MNVESPAAVAEPVLSVASGVSFTLRSAGRPHCLVRTNGSAYFRIGLREYAFVTLVDGRRTLGQIVERLGREEDLAISLEEGRRVAEWLLQNGLVVPAGRPDGSPDDARRRRGGAGVFSPISARMPLFDPDPLLERLTPALGWLFGPAGSAVWGLFGLLALVVYLSGGVERSILDPFDGANWIVFAAAWLVLKVVHEFGHGLACKRYGGEVRETGLVFVLFSPIAYVDVSSSWGFRSRWARIHTALGGLQAESLVAFLAVLAAASCRSDAWSGAFLSVAFVAGPVSALVNLNPFLRLDGYHVATEVLAHPNLYSESQRWLRAVLGRVLLGPTSEPPLDDFRRRTLLSVYGLLAFGFRLGVYTGLVLAATWLLHGFGLVLGVVALGYWPGLPLARQTGRLLAGKLGGWRTSLRCGVLATSFGTGLAAAAALAPWPFGSSAPGVVDYENAVRVHAETAGFVERVEVVAGQSVREGDVLVVLRSAEAETRVRETEARLRERELAVRQAVARGDAAEAETAREQLELVRRERDLALARQRGLVVRAPVDGRVLGPDTEALTGTFVDEGEQLVEVGDVSSKVFVALLTQNQAEALLTGTAVSASVDLWGRPTMESRPKSSDPRASRLAERPELTSLAGGPLLVAARRNESTGRQSDQLVQQFEVPRVEVRTTLPSDVLESVRTGETGTLSWNGRGERVGEVLVRRVRTALKRPVATETR